MANQPVLKSAEEIKIMRLAGRIVAKSLQRVKQAAKPGISGEELDALAEATIRSLGGRPSFKGYGGFPASICLSLNDEVVHGIPGSRRLQPGDVVGVDLGAQIDGFHGDGAITFCVGAPSTEAERLMEVTKGALMKGIKQARAGNKLSDISRAIQSWVEKAGYSVVRDLVGHGIGREIHEPPQVPNVVIDGPSLVLKTGMTLAIEPMVNIGDWKIRREADGWTYRTKDGSLSAHFEHTVAITEKGPEILTSED